MKERSSTTLTEPVEFLKEIVRISERSKVILERKSPERCLGCGSKYGPPLINETKTNHTISYSCGGCGFRITFFWPRKYPLQQLLDFLGFSPFLSFLKGGTD